VITDAFMIESGSSRRRAAIPVDLGGWRIEGGESPNRDDHGAVL
jgi:hypothetical protein